MKKNFTQLIVAFFIIFVFVLLFIFFADKQVTKVLVTGNIDKKPIYMNSGEFQCSECKMIIQDINFSAQVIDEDGKTWFFDDIGCVVLWLRDKSFENDLKIYTFAYDTKKWIDATKAWYSLDSNTPMEYGFASHEIKNNNFVNYEIMKNKVLRGETLHDPFVKKQLLGDRSGSY